MSCAAGGELFERLEAGVGREARVCGREYRSPASAAPEGSEAASRFVAAPGAAPMIPARRYVEVFSFESAPPAGEG